MEGQCHVSVGLRSCLQKMQTKIYQLMHPLGRESLALVRHRDQARAG
jgi:hypothetical protein